MCPACDATAWVREGKQYPEPKGRCQNSGCGLQLAAASCSRLLAKCCEAHLPAGGVLLSFACVCKLGEDTLV